MKIILVAYAYPPFPIVGSVRAERVANALLRAGHEVHVITARLPKESRVSRAEAPGLTITPVRSWPHPLHLYRKLKERVVGSREPTGPSPAGQPQLARATQWKSPPEMAGWKRGLLSILRTPDEYQGFVIPAFARAVGAARDGADLIYTTSPPHSAHLVGLLAQRLLGLRWAAELRDPWVDNQAQRAGDAEVSSRLAEATDAMLERRCLTAADRVFTVTERAAAALEERIPELRGEVVVVRNGIDRLGYESRTRAPGPFRILYAGGIGGGRDPRPVLKALADLGREFDHPADQLRLDMVGNCRFYQDVDLAGLCRQLGIANLVHFTPWLDHGEVRTLQEESDLLVLLAQEQPAQVPNKLYEYLGAGAPILALADADGESAAMLREVGGHYLVPADGRTVAGALREAYRGFRRGQPFAGDGPATDILQKWSTERQFGMLVEELALAPTSARAL